MSEFRLEVEPQSKLGNPVATIASCRAPCGPRLAEVAGAKIAATTNSGCRADEVGMVEQVEEVGLERHSRSFIDFKILGDVEIYDGPGRSDQTVALDRRVAPQAVVDGGGASEANPIRIGQTKRRTSPCQLVGDDSAFWNQPIRPIAVFVRVRAVRIERRPGVTRLVADDGVRTPATNPTVLFEERQIVADGADHAMASIEVCPTIIEVGVHVVGRAKRRAVQKEIAEVIQPLGVGIVCVEG